MRDMQNNRPGQALRPQRPRSNPINQGQPSSWVFCPNCGLRYASEYHSCPRCGTKNPVRKSQPKLNKKTKRIIIIIAILSVILVGLIYLYDTSFRTDDSTAKILIESSITKVTEVPLLLDTSLMPLYREWESDYKIDIGTDPTKLDKYFSDMSAFTQKEDYQKMIQEIDRSIRQSEEQINGLRKSCPRKFFKAIDMLELMNSKNKKLLDLVSKPTALSDDNLDEMADTLSEMNSLKKSIKQELDKVIYS